MTFICVDSNVLLRIAGQINRILTSGDPASTDSSTIATAHRSKLEKKKKAQLLTATNVFWGETREARW
jgi:hypothetical protein